MSLDRVYSVSEINAYIKRMFSQDFFLGRLTITGEVSNCKYNSRGHIYFTLKEKDAAISCVMFAGQRQGLRFQMKDGDQVIVDGRVDVYEVSGVYQVYASSIRLAGSGELYERYEALKKELQEMGMFDDLYKKPIPKFVRTIGVVTASTGAVIHDIETTVQRRNPTIQVILYPCQVQGAGAAATIIEGIRYFEKNNVDVLIVGRGGGSIEDLWEFNDETLARVVFECPIPIISAVGHESDHTIIDEVADRRAATPTAAAELATWLYQETLDEVANLQMTMDRGVFRTLEKLRSDVVAISGNLKARSPERRLDNNRLRVDDIATRIGNKIDNILLNKKHMMAILAGRIDSASPMKKLASGYSFVTDSKGKLASFNETMPGDELTLHMLEGDILATVKEKKECPRI